jgi:putative oxidoreductase
MFKRLFFGGDGGASPLADIGLMICRAGVGLLLALGHGLGKIRNPGGMAGGLEKMGIPAPTLASWLAAIAEFFGGILLALGLATRPAAFLIAATMAVAVVAAHGKDPTFMSAAETRRTERVENGKTVIVESRGGTKEPALLFLLPAVMFLFTGSGRFGVDGLLRGRDPARLPLADEPSSAEPRL